MSEAPISEPALIHQSRNDTSGHIRYRADIDGLRAVAVLPVVLYHAGFTTFGGGFVGVDVFFVISGFLITSLILNDIEAGNFSLVRFYERRIRRIFPALFAVIGVCSVAAWFLFMPVELAYFARSVIAAALFGSNVLFWQESGYFDTAARLKPLLHTWSLAVEEQFYIFFPLLLLALHGFRRHWTAPVLLMLAVLSFGLNIWATEHAAEFAFYMSPPRFWELLLGALIALGIIPDIGSRLLNQILTAAGLGLIAFSVFTYAEATSFPGTAALLPCLGAALVLHAGRRGGPVTDLLRARPVVFVGLISYSLYLWHWPIFVFVSYYLGAAPSTPQAVLIIAASLVISALSWRWIEQPFRRSRPTASRSALFGSAGVAMAVVIGFGVTVNALQGAPDRLPADVMSVYSARNDVLPIDEAKCLTGDGSQFEEIVQAGGCVLPLGELAGKPPQYIVWGDSHARAMGPGIAEAAQRAGVAGLLLSIPSCPPLLDFDTGASQREKKERCRRANHAAMTLIAQQRIPLVFMVARWPKYAHHSEYGKEGVFFDPAQPIGLDDYSAKLSTALDITLEELARAGSKPVVVMDVPEMGYDIPHALAKATLTRASSDVAPTREAVRRRQALALQVLTTAAARHGAALVDPTPGICDQKRCYPKKGSLILYADEDHLTLAGASSISHIFDPLFRGGFSGQR